jgi:hypothetical protein
LLFIGTVQAEPVFSFDAASGKLPKTVVPINYSIERDPTLSLALPGVEVIGGFTRRLRCVALHRHSG